MDSNSSRAYLKLDLSDYDLEGLSAVHLKDTYCSNPDCSCGGAILYPTRLAGSELEDWIEPAKEIQFIVNVQTGEVLAKAPSCRGAGRRRIDPPDRGRSGAAHSGQRVGSSHPGVHWHGPDGEYRAEQLHLPQ